MLPGATGCGLLLNADRLQRFELAEVEAGHGGLQLRELDAGSAGGADEAVAAHDGDFESAAGPLRRLLLHQGSATFGGLREAVPLLPLTLPAPPARQPDETAGAARIS